MSPILPDMSSLATFKHLSTIRVAMTTCASIPLAPPFLAYNGKGGISCLPPYLLLGKPVLLYTTVLGWLLLTKFVPLGCPARSTLTTGIAASFVIYTIFVLWFRPAAVANFIACTILISLGYFIGLKKCVLQPSTALRFLGYICDSLKQAFILPQDKRAKFASLRDSILAHKAVSLKNLQKFADKTKSFALLFLAAKLFSNEAYWAISRCCKASTSHFRITKDLRKDLLHWRFLDSWEGFLPRRDERHFQLTLFSDASFSGWGTFLKLPGEAPVEARGYWDKTSRGYHIGAKETRDLSNAV